jgi:hypothetical protein
MKMIARLLMASLLGIAILTELFCARAPGSVAPRAQAFRERSYSFR